MLLFNNETIDGDKTSATIHMDQFDYFSIQSVVTGTPVCALNVEVSNDQENWSTADSVDVTTATSWSWVSKHYAFKYLRMTVSYTSGSGTITAAIRGKGSRNACVIE